MINKRDQAIHSGYSGFLLVLDTAVDKTMRVPTSCAVECVGNSNKMSGEGSEWNKGEKTLRVCLGTDAWREVLG